MLWNEFIWYKTLIRFIKQIFRYQINHEIWLPLHNFLCSFKHCCVFLQKSRNNPSGTTCSPLCKENFLPPIVSRHPISVSKVLAWLFAYTMEIWCRRKSKSHRFQSWPEIILQLENDKLEWRPMHEMNFFRACEILDAFESSAHPWIVDEPTEKVKPSSYFTTT